MSAKKKSVKKGNANAAKGRSAADALSKEKKALAAKARRAAEKAKAKQRSEAAKKGWETRRKNQAKKQAKLRASENRRTINVIRQALPKKKRAKELPVSDITNPQLAGKTIEELQAIIEKQNELLARAHWVDAVDIEYLRRNGTITAYPSKLRNTEEYFPIKARLSYAFEEGDEYFDYEVEEVALEYDVTTREIYNMFFS